MSRFVGAGKKLMSFLTPKPKVNTTELGKATSKLNIAIQKGKASNAKLKQTVFEMKNNMPLTFKKSNKKSIKESDRKKKIIKDNNKVINKMFKKALKEDK